MHVTSSIWKCLLEADTSISALVPLNSLRNRSSCRFFSCSLFSLCPKMLTVLLLINRRPPKEATKHMVFCSSSCPSTAQQTKAPLRERQRRHSVRLFLHRRRTRIVPKTIRVRHPRPWWPFVARSGLRLLRRLDTVPHAECYDNLRLLV